MRDWCTAYEHGVRIAVQVAPNARQNEIVGPLEDCLKLRLQAQPVEGQANAALVRYLAELLGVPRSAVEVTHGLTARRKLVEVQSAQLGVADVRILLRKK